MQNTELYSFSNEIFRTQSDETHIGLHAEGEKSNLSDRGPKLWPSVLLSCLKNKTECYFLEAFNGSCNCTEWMVRHIFSYDQFERKFGINFLFPFLNNINIHLFVIIPSASICIIGYLVLGRRCILLEKLVDVYILWLY